MRAAVPRKRRWLAPVILMVMVILSVTALGWLLFARAHGGLAELIAGNQPPPWPAAVAPVRGYAATVRVDLAKTLTVLPDEFLSFSIDASQLVGGRWWREGGGQVEGGSGTLDTAPLDLGNPRLRELARALAPAWLRVGGSEADQIWYDMASTGAAEPSRPAPNPPAGFRSVLTRQRWDQLYDFAQAASLRLDFTLNAGPGPRLAGVWQDDNARSLLSHVREEGQQVEAWEFGNELNGYWFVHGPAAVVSQSQYAADFLRFSGLVRELAPGSLAVMQGSAFWPVLGEAMAPLLGFMDSSLAGIGPLLDRVNWHYYPQQSRRAPIATRRAAPGRLLDPAALDEAAYWAGRVQAWRDQYAPGKPVWLGETGNAQFGGEPGLSDRYIAGLWWLDQLGLMARSGVTVVVRQCLVGLDYGLLDGAILEPRPDYWNSLLWKRLMGNRVLSATVRLADGDGAPKLRAYAQAGPGGVCLLLINLDPARPVQVALPDFAGMNGLLLQCDSPDPLSRNLRVNGTVLELGAGLEQALSSIKHRALKGIDGVSLAPLSYCFAYFPG